MIGLFLGQLVSALVPIKVKAETCDLGKRGRLIIALLNCAAGGFFFGGYLMRLYPEARSILDKSLLTPTGLKYPIPELVIGLGFFLVAFVDYAVFLALQKADDKTETENAERIGGEDTWGTFLLRDAMDKLERTPVTQVHEEDPLVPLRSRTESQISTRPGRILTKNVSFADAVAITRITHDVEAEHERRLISREELPQQETIEHSKDGVARSSMLYLALGLDSLLGGLTLGLRESVHSVIVHFAVLICHQCLMAFGIGLDLALRCTTGVTIWIGVVYSLTPVMSVSVGTAIAEVAGYQGSRSFDITTGILQCVCCGTFIYCCFFGILTPNLTGSHSMYKSLVTLLSFGVMAAAVTVSTHGADVHLRLNGTIDVPGVQWTSKPPITTDQN